MTKPDFVYVIYIATTPEKVWAALTDGNLSHEYWGGRRIESDWKVGSPVAFKVTQGPPSPTRAVVLEIAPLKRLVMQWISERSGQPVPATKVTFDIQAAGPTNVKLTVTHEPDAAGSEVSEDVRQGWPAILSSLKSFLETGRALDMTKSWSAGAR